MSNTAKKLAIAAVVALAVDAISHPKSHTHAAINGLVAGFASFTIITASGLLTDHSTETA